MIYAFENFELDDARAELRRDGEPVAVEPQVFELIKLLIRARDRVVTRGEILKEIWDDRIVSEATLSSRLRDARKAIGDDGTRQRLIRTVQRRGLRFIGEAREVRSAETRQAAREPLAAPEQSVADDILDRPAIAVMPFEKPIGDRR